MVSHNPSFGFGKNGGFLLKVIQKGIPHSVADHRRSFRPEDSETVTACGEKVISRHR